MPDAEEVAKLIAKLLSEITGKEVEAKLVGGNNVTSHLVNHVKDAVKRGESEMERHKGTKPLAEVKVTAKFKERFDALDEAAGELSKRMKRIERVFMEMAKERESLWEDICEEIEVDGETHFVRYDEDKQVFQVWKKKDDDGKEEKKPKKRFVFDDDDE